MSPNETELKLRVAAADLPRLIDAPLLVDIADEQQLRSVYFDTPSLKLHRRGTALRVRERDGSYIQTLKTAAEQSAGALRRGEWEAAVSGPAPELGKLDKAAAAHLDGIEAGDLTALFESRIARRVCMLHPGGDGSASIEAAIDVGEIAASGGTAVPVTELELELKAGSPHHLYEVALVLNSVVPLHLETRSKSQRGYELLQGPGAEARHAVALKLDRHATAEQAIDAVLRACLTHMLENEAEIVARRHPAALHQMRVGLRRLRSAFSLFGKLLPAERHRHFTNEARWLGLALGRARDADVLLSDLLEPARTSHPDLPGLEAIHQAAKIRRDEAYDGVMAAISSPRYATFVLELLAWLEGRGWRDQPVTERSVRLLGPIEAIARPMLKRLHARALELAHDLESRSPDERHQLRIALKRLRYATEFFRSLYKRKPVDRYLDQVIALQSALGTLNDGETARRITAEIFDPSAAIPAGERSEAGMGDVVDMLTASHAARIKTAERTLFEDWAGFESTRRYWRSS